MITLNLQYFGGRGASSGAGTFKSAADFENALTGLNDPRLAEYRNAYSEENAYNKGLKDNLNQSIVEDGYTDFTDVIINDEIRSTKNELKALPTNKTPEQLGREKGLNERMDVLNDLKARKGEKAKGRRDEEIVTQKPTRAV